MSKPENPANRGPWSMTGYGEGSAGRVHASIRAVNSRFLEIRLRTPPALRGSEAALENWLKGRLGRGKVDATLTLETARAAADPGELRARLELWRATGLLEAPVSLGDLLKLAAENGEAEADPALAIEAEAALAGALVPFEAERRREGAGLAAEIGRLLGEFTERLAAVRAAGADAPGQIRATLAARLREIPLDPPVDPQRVAQEVALLAERADITEELARLDVHLAAVRALLGRDEVGKKLDFYTQELGREVNTIGSKSRSAEIAGGVIEMKALLEKIREQAANLG